jgi:hypothetical protein
VACSVVEADLAAAPAAVEAAEDLVVLAAEVVEAAALAAVGKRNL